MEELFSGSREWGHVSEIALHNTGLRNAFVPSRSMAESNLPQIKARVISYMYVYYTGLG